MEAGVCSVQTRNGDTERFPCPGAPQRPAQFHSSCMHFLGNNFQSICFMSTLFICCILLQIDVRTLPLLLNIWLSAWYLLAQSWTQFISLVSSSLFCFSAFLVPCCRVQIPLMLRLFWFRLKPITHAFGNLWLLGGAIWQLKRVPVTAAKSLVVTKIQLHCFQSPGKGRANFSFFFCKTARTVKNSPLDNTNR